MTELKGNENLRTEIVQLMAGDQRSVDFTVSRKTLKTVLQRFVNNDLHAREVADWASLIEACDQVEYEPGFERLIADIVFELASPEINGALTDQSCQRWMQRIGI